MTGLNFKDKRETKHEMKKINYINRIFLVKIFGFVPALGN